MERALDDQVQAFIRYGGVLDAPTRRYIAGWLLERLLPGYSDRDGLQPGYFSHFSKLLDGILADDALREVTHRHPMLAAQVCIDLLGWFRRRFGEVLAQHPFEHEQHELEGWSVRPMKHVVARFDYFVSAIANHYTRDEIDPGYHSAQFRALPGGWSTLTNDQQREIGRLFDDLLAQWDGQLQAKILDFHLRSAQPIINDLAENLHGKAREYRQLEALIEPFTHYVGRYWDLSRDLWANEGFDVIRSYRELLDREEELRQLAELLGRLREAERITEEVEHTEHITLRSWQRDPSKRDEIIGVFASNDLNRLLPSEVAYLAEPQTESVFFKRFAEQQLLTTEFEHRYLDERSGEAQVSQTVSRKKERGPFIVCVDTSGSMEGLPERVAKVLCFGIMKMAAREERKAFLINFSTGIQTLDLLNIADSIGDLAHFLKQSFHGGTDLSLALDAALNKLETDDFNDADVLIISDFVMYTIDPSLRRRMAFRRVNRNTRFYGMIISDEPNEAVTSIFDRVWRYNEHEKTIVHEVVTSVVGG